MRLVASHMEYLLSRIVALGVELDIPPREEYVAAASTALRDIHAAIVSTYHIAYLTFRPLVLLSILAGSRLADVLQVIARHSLLHGIVALREGYLQLQTGAQYFVEFQRGLSPTAKYAQLGLLALLVGLWLLRRHVRKNRYVERLRAWHQARKRRLLRRYHRIVTSVAETSLVLALLLPHLLYVVAWAGAKRLVPSVVTYLATRTFLNSLIAFWHPLYLTLKVCSRLIRHLRAYYRGEESQLTASEEDVDDRTNRQHRPFMSSPTGRASRRSLMTPAKMKQQRQQRAEMEQLRAEALQLLKYWTVYAMLFALFRFGQLLPIIGRFLQIPSSPNAHNATKRRAASRFSFRHRSTMKNGGIFSKFFLSFSNLHLSRRVAEEIRLVFFTWLRFMPSSLLIKRNENSVAADIHSEINLHNDAKPLIRESSLSSLSSMSGGKLSSGKKHNFRPVDIMYRKLSPLALSAMNSSAFLAKSLTDRGNNNSDNNNNNNSRRRRKSKPFEEEKDNRTYFALLIQKLRSLLDLVVMIRLISPQTRDSIITTVVESSALLPAAVTLLMPSYFTNYGVIYVSLIIPAGYSIESCDSLHEDNSGHDKEAMLYALDDASRYLQFWVVHASTSLLLRALSPLLAWIPLSTHATWLLWAYVQMDSPTRSIYHFLESELSAFGLVSVAKTQGDSQDSGLEYNEYSTKSLEDTTIVRSMRKILASLPSSVESKPMKDTLKEEEEEEEDHLASSSNSINDIPETIHDDIEEKETVINSLEGKVNANNKSQQPEPTEKASKDVSPVVNLSETFDKELIIEDDSSSIMSETASTEKNQQQCHQEQTQTEETPNSSDSPMDPPGDEPAE